MDAVRQPTFIPHRGHEPRRKIAAKYEDGHPEGKEIRIYRTHFHGMAQLNVEIGPIRDLDVADVRGARVQQPIALEAERTLPSFPDHQRFGNHGRVQGIDISDHGQPETFPPSFPSVLGPQGLPIQRLENGVGLIKAQVP